MGKANYNMSVRGAFPRKGVCLVPVPRGWFQLVAHVLNKLCVGEDLAMVRGDVWRIDVATRDPFQTIWISDTEIKILTGLVYCGPNVDEFAEHTHDITEVPAEANGERVLYLEHQVDSGTGATGVGWPIVLSDTWAVATTLGFQGLDGVRILLADYTVLDGKITRFHRRYRAGDIHLTRYKFGATGNSKLYFTSLSLSMDLRSAGDDWLDHSFNINGWTFTAT